MTRTHGQQSGSLSTGVVFSGACGDRVSLGCTRCHAAHLLEAGEAAADDAAGGVADGGAAGGVLAATGVPGACGCGGTEPAAGAGEAEKFERRSFSSPWQWMQCMHTVQRPVILARLVRSLSAGPSRMPMYTVRWSSVSRGRLVPSIDCSRNFCEDKVRGEL